MAKEKNLFRFLAKAGEEVVEAIKLPLREKKLGRVADRVADDLEGKKLEAEGKKQELMRALAKSDNEDEMLAIYKRIAAQTREVAEAAELVKAVNDIRKELFGPAPDVESK
jgi:hypothetical protein